MATKRSNRIDNSQSVDNTWAPDAGATPSEALMALFESIGVEWVDEESDAMPPCRCPGGVCPAGCCGTDRLDRHLDGLLGTA